MTEEKHTPGPWHFYPQEGFFPRVYIGGERPEKAELVGDYISVNAAFPNAGSDTHNANARLIAAAPDLLAALEAELSEIESDIQWADASDLERLCVRRDRIAAAIAKARGQA